MPYLIILLLLLWSIRCIKAELFWLYLLQLKEYKTKRFIDHFRTEKGQRLLGDKINIFKILIALVSLLIFNYLNLIVILIYLVELAGIIKNFLANALKYPVVTKKSIPLIAISIAIQIIFGVFAFMNIIDINLLALYLLVFDIFIPLILLFVVMLLKPINRLMKKRIIDAAKAKRIKLKDLLVIGITGSYGKTSTKEFLYEILKDKFNVIRTPEHVNTEIGASDFILKKLNAKHEIFICEMGAYEKGEVKETSDIVRPQIGVFLGANEQHLSLFGTMENLLKAEGGEELLNALKENAKESSNSRGALGIFNGNNIYAYELWKRADIPKRITYVPNLVEIINPEKRDVRAENIRVEKEHVSFRVLTNKNSKGVDFRVNLLGAHNIENILLCVALGESLGLTLEEVKTSVKNIQPFPRTMSMTKDQNGITTIDSTYSSNPTALQAHLEYLKVWDKKRIVIMPCLIELGSASSKIHTNIGRLLAKNVDLVIVITKDKFAEILDGAAEILGEEESKKKIIYSENPEEIANVVRDFSKKGDVILLEGRLPDKLVKNLQNS